MLSLMGSYLAYLNNVMGKVTTTHSELQSGGRVRRKGGITKARLGESFLFERKGPLRLRSEGDARIQQMLS